MPAIAKENRLNVDMKQAYHDYRAMRLRGLAARVCSIVGAHEPNIVRMSQLMAHADELKAKLQGPVYTYTTSLERKDLYHVRNDSRYMPAGVKLGAFALKMAGYAVSFDGSEMYYTRAVSA